MVDKQKILDLIYFNSSKLTKLDLSGKGVTDEDLKDIITALQTNNYIKELNLSSNFLADASKFEKLDNIQILNLSDNPSIRNALPEIIQYENLRQCSIIYTSSSESVKNILQSHNSAVENPIFIAPPLKSPLLISPWELSMLKPLNTSIKSHRKPLKKPIKSSHPAKDFSSSINVPPKPEANTDPYLSQLISKCGTFGSVSPVSSPKLKPIHKTSSSESSIFASSSATQSTTSPSTDRQSLVLPRGPLSSFV